ncbi:serine/threonine-protein kinase polo-like [Planococcus citri]|uniref:serine/threonine-protein kinase polo-like n=1 Tax=Planococcus citri TaxID=170843 RepID=UPI0031F995E8
MTSLIRDSDNNTYVKENYLGKGAFSKSYILKREDQTYCGKFIARDKHHLEKQLDSIQEFKILSKLSHKNIVNFVKCIETPRNFCLITEYYPNKSMFELIQRRGKLTIYEVRFFCKQLLSALKYLHDNNVVHRDIKPQNMLLDEKMNLRLSDFGMAVLCPKTKTIYKRHIYGTPNYISPEMITKSVFRYNYKVDIWAVGCFLYHMYTGRTPFRGKDEKVLYNNIQNCLFYLPTDMPETLSSLIQRIFQKDPDNRPNARQILSSEFFKNGFTPNSLPISALVEKPKFIVTYKEPKAVKKVEVIDSKFCENKCYRRCLKHYENYISQLINKPNTKYNDDKSRAFHHEIEYPMLNPFVWITKVVKNNKYKHIGYELNDGTKGVLFEDKTVLALLPNQRNLYYVTLDKQVKFYTISKHSTTLKDKLSILKHIFNVNIGSETSTVQNNIFENKDWLPMLPYLLSYYETTKYFILLLSNGLYEVISKIDDLKLILCTKTNGFSILSDSGKLKTYDLNSLLDFDYPEYLHKNLEITYSSLKRVLTKNECFACKKELEAKC